MALNINKANSRMNDNIFNRLNFLAKVTLKEWDSPKNSDNVQQIIEYNFDKLNPKSLLKLASVLNIPYSEELKAESEIRTRKNKSFNTVLLQIEQKLQL